MTPPAVDPALPEVLPEVPTPDATATTEPTPTPSPEQSVVPEPGPAPVPTEDPAAPVPDATPGETPVPTSEPTPTPTQSTTVVPSPATTSSPGVVVPLPGSRPAVTQHEIPWGAVVAAVLVLVLVTAGLVWWWRRSGGGTRAEGTAAAVAGQGDDEPTVVLPVPGALTPDAGDEHSTVVLPDTGAATTGVDASPLTARTDATVRFLVRLGEAMIDAGSPIVQVDSTMQRVAAENGLRDAAVVTLPTAVIVSVPQHETVQTAVSTAGSRGLRLDQVADVLDLADAASRGEVEPTDGLRRLETIVRSEPASSPARRAGGYVAVAAGLCLVLGGSWADTLVAAVLGGVVAVLSALTRRVPPVYQGLLIGGYAFVVAVPVLLLVRTGWPIGLLAPLAAPLVTFLPGALLTTGVIDLATRQMIAGSARLAAGGMQLVLLALGITAAAGLVGVPASDVGSGGSGQPLGWVGAWAGVLVYAVGVVLNNDAHRGTLPWITLVLVVAYAGQVVGGVLFGAVVSSFVGALLMTPVAMLAAVRRSGPPFLVTFLPGFWVLVPGSLGLVGVTSALDASTTRALTTIVTTGVSMVAICLGVLAGLALGGLLQRRIAPDAPRIV